MIYRANNNPLVLTEDAADAFLESVGVKLYEDEISINGTLYEGAYGESILEANGIFLYEDGIVLEGKTKEEYEREKAEKRASAEEENHRDFLNADRRAQRTSSSATALKHAKAKGAKGEEKWNIYDQHDKGKYGYNSASYSDKVSDMVVKRLHDGKPLTAHQANRLKDSWNRKKRGETKKERRKMYGKKSTNESTIFSDIEII